MTTQRKFQAAQHRRATVTEATHKTGLAHPDDMTPEQIATALKNTYILETWIKAVRAHAFELLKNGGKIPGFKLGYGVRRRIWKEGQEGHVAAALRKEGFVDDDIFTKPELLSPAKVEELLKDRGKWPAKPRGGERPPTLIDPYVDRSMPEPAIKPEDEGEGPAAKAKAAAEEFSK